jgi:hypothetical protein
LTEEEKDKPKEIDVASWRPSPEAKELLGKVTGEARKKLLNKLVEQEAKRQHELSASPCELRTLDWVDTLKTNYIPYFEKKLKQDEANRGYSDYADDHIVYDKKEINWAKWWLNHYRRTCICGSPRGHSPEEAGKPDQDGFYVVKSEWIAASKSYEPETKQARR